MSANTLFTASAFTALVGADTDDATNVATVIEWVSVWINTTTRYKILARAVTEYRDGDGGNVMWLRETPVSSVTLNIDSGMEFASGTAYVEWSESSASGDFVVDSETGRVTLINGSFSTGMHTVKFVYTGGHATVPSDLEGAAMRLARLWYDQIKDGLIGKASLNSGGGNASYLPQVPDDIQKIAEQYAPKGGFA